MSFAKRELLMSPHLRQLTLVLGVGAALGLAGPFATYPTLAPPVRYAFWMAMVLAGYVAAMAAERLVPNRWASRERPVARGLLLAAASALPMTFLVAWVLPLVRPGRVVTPDQLPALFTAVGVVQLLIVTALLRRPAPLPPPLPPPSAVVHPDAPPVFPAALLARLPERLGRDIVALEAEDHYLRVHTPLGSDLLLMRLSDAVGSIDSRLGAQVHRSWWVARGAVAEVVKDGQRTRLRLTSGLSVPVGRTYMAAARAGLV
jgi:hypothetical protein